MSIYKLLFPWQKKIVDKYKDRDSYGLFLDMGLGKTPISLGFSEVNNVDYILVISINAKALETNKDKYSFPWWADKMNSDYQHLNKYSSLDSVSANTKQMLVINYESTFKSYVNKKGARVRDINPLITEFIKASKDKRVAMIIDESHRLKNLSSVQTKTIRKINTQFKRWAKSTYTYLLTGTPFTQGYIDLYSQLKLLGYSGTKATYMDNFCVRGTVPGLLTWQQPIVSYKNIDQLYETVHRYALTIMSEDVEELPEQTFRYHSSKQSKAFNMFTLEKVKSSYIEKELKSAGMPEHIHENKDKLINNPFYRNMTAPTFDLFAETSGTFWLRSRQVGIGFQGNADKHTWYDDTRFKKIEAHLDNNRENTLIFYNYTAELFALYDICEKLGYDIDIYSGDIKSLHYYEQYEAMNKDERFNARKRVIIANFASGSTGKNWQLYNHCVISSVPLYGHYAQAIKRIHRIGQTKTVFYHIFYQDNWLDNGMIETLKGQVEYNSDLFEADLEKAQLIYESEDTT